MTAVQIMLQSHPGLENQPSIPVDQPLARCDDLRAMFEMWAQDQARDKWVLGNQCVFFREKRDAQRFYDWFTRQDMSFGGHLWYDPPPPPQITTWVAFADDQYGNGFIASAPGMVMSNKNYVGFATAPYLPIPSNFTWVKIKSF